MSCAPWDVVVRIVISPSKDRSVDLEQPASTRTAIRSLRMARLYARLGVLAKRATTPSGALAFGSMPGRLARMRRILLGDRPAFVLLFLGPTALAIVLDFALR